MFFKYNFFSIRFDSKQRCLKRCKFVEFGKERAYFDFENMQKLGNNINIILGYKASIDMYGSRLLLCTELASKLINQDTVLDVNI